MKSLSENSVRWALVIAAVVLLFALLSSPKQQRTERCPDGADCPVEELHLPAVVRERDLGNSPLDVGNDWRRLVSMPVSATTGVVLELPPELRTKNWGGGSCVHASNVNLLKHQGQFEMAEWWRKTYSGGEYDSRLISRLEKAGLRYAYTNSEGGEAFFAWVTRTRRGAGIFYKPKHSINFVGMDSQYAYLLDNNATNYPEQQGHYERVPLAEFYPRWRGYGGFAWTLVYDPAPSEPYFEE